MYIFCDGIIEKLMNFRSPGKSSPRRGFALGGMDLPFTQAHKPTSACVICRQIPLRSVTNNNKLA